MIKPKDIKIGAKVKHVADKKFSYTITDVNCCIKINNIWHQVICYSPNYTTTYTRFARNIDDFISNFELIKK